MVDPERPIVWSSDALADLSEIWNYSVENFGPATGNKIIRDIGESCRLLGTYPFAGRSRDEVRRGLRSVGSPPHVIFYRIVEERVEIVRVLHGRRDIDQIFADISDSP